MTPLPTNIHLPADCLLVFVDDTGHETLAATHVVYGLGGCAVLAANLDPLVRTPWKEVRRKVNGSPDAPLHASDFTRTASKEQMAAVGDFFRDKGFARVGVSITTKTELADELTAVATVPKSLLKRIEEVAQWQPCGSVAIIFESSERADKLIEKALGELRVQIEGKDAPIACYFMEKSVNDPALEVADFVAHAVHGHAKEQLKDDPKPRPDMQAVFCDVDPQLQSYMHVTSVKKNA